MLNSRENHDKISTIDFDFFNESYNEVKYYEKIHMGVHHNDYSKIVTKAVIETNQVQLYNSSENSLSSSSSSGSIYDVSNNEDKCIDKCLAYIENNDSNSENDISDISNDSFASSSLFTSVSPLTLSESSCALEISSGSESSPQANEIEYILPYDKEKLDNAVDSFEQIKTSELLIEKPSHCESQPTSGDCNDEEKSEGDIESNSCSEDKSEMCCAKLERTIDVILDSQTISNSCSSESTLSKGSTKLRIRKKDINLTFNREEMIKIERDNLILLKKIMAHSKPKAVLLNKPFSHKKTSAAINRAKQQKKIEQDNYILYSKISSIGRMKKIF